MSVALIALVDRIEMSALWPYRPFNIYQLFCCWSTFYKSHLLAEIVGHKITHDGLYTEIFDNFSLQAAPFARIRHFGGAEFAGPENDGPKKIKDWKCRTWHGKPGKWRTKSQGWKMQNLENDELNRWKMTDQITRLENAYFRYCDIFSLIAYSGALIAVCTTQKNTFCVLKSNV